MADHAPVTETDCRTEPNSNKGGERCENEGEIRENDIYALEQEIADVEDEIDATRARLQQAAAAIKSIQTQRKKMETDFAQLQHKSQTLSKNNARVYWRYVPANARCFPHLATTLDVQIAPPAALLAADVCELQQQQLENNRAFDAVAALEVCSDDSDSDDSDVLDERQDWLDIGKRLENTIIGGDMEEQSSSGGRRRSWSNPHHHHPPKSGGDEYQLLDCIGCTQNALLFHCRLLHRHFEDDVGMHLPRATRSHSPSSARMDFQSLSTNGLGEALGVGADTSGRGGLASSGAWARSSRGHHRVPSNSSVSSVGSLEHLGGEETLIMRVYCKEFSVTHSAAFLRGLEAELSTLRRFSFEHAGVGLPRLHGAAHNHHVFGIALSTLDMPAGGHSNGEVTVTTLLQFLENEALYHKHKTSRSPEFGGRAQLPPDRMSSHQATNVLESKDEIRQRRRDYWAHRVILRDVAQSLAGCHTFHTYGLAVRSDSVVVLADGDGHLLATDHQDQLPSESQTAAPVFLHEPEPELQLSPAEGQLESVILRDCSASPRKRLQPLLKAGEGVEVGNHEASTNHSMAKSNASASDKAWATASHTGSPPRLLNSPSTPLAVPAARSRMGSGAKPPRSGRSGSPGSCLHETKSPGVSFRGRKSFQSSARPPLSSKRHQRSGSNGLLLDPRGVATPAVRSSSFDAQQSMRRSTFDRKHANRRACACLTDFHGALHVKSSGAAQPMWRPYWQDAMEAEEGDDLGVREWCHPLCFAAPEVIQDPPAVGCSAEAQSRALEPADVWGLGIIALHVLLGSDKFLQMWDSAFQEAHDDNVLLQDPQGVVEVALSEVERALDNADEKGNADFQALRCAALACLTVDPATRCSAEEFVRML
eukprot:INCI4065.1.p1 GENE.INCI4065.1~~INCI4065.1.p1  ORF type:complete len:878 (-),score=139.10 INCI4065.1:870-3503(-)